jgi:hypothetical protein
MRRREDVVRDLCLPSRGSSSTSADTVAHLAFHSWREAAHSAGDRNNSREHAVGHSPGVAGNRTAFT